MFPRKKLKTHAIIQSTASRMKKKQMCTGNFISGYKVTKRIIFRTIKRNE